jgi:hypothetical protein
MTRSQGGHIFETVSLGTPVASHLRKKRTSLEKATVMAKNKIDAPVVLSTDEARAGVTGHHVRYVLAFGLLGSLIAFLIIGLYYGFGASTQSVAAMFAGEGTLAQRLILIAVPLALLAVATVLLLGLRNMVWGRSAVTSQRLMRWRVALQFIALCLVMAALYLSVR